MRPSRTSSSAAAKVAASADRRNRSPRTSCGRKFVNSRQSGTWPRKCAKRFSASSIEANAEGSMVCRDRPSARAPRRGADRSAPHTRRDRARAAPALWPDSSIVTGDRQHELIESVGGHSDQPAENIEVDSGLLSEERKHKQKQ